MDLILKLPKSLQSLSNQDVPSVVQERLHYLWNACNNLAIRSPALAHRMSRSFVQLSNKYDVDLPDYISCRLCKHCCGIQIPSKTCSLRLRARSAKSSSGRESSKPKNQIVFHCTLCKGVSNKVTSYSSNDDSGLSGKKRSLGDMQVNSMVSLSSTMSSPGPKFSFLNKQSTKSPSVMGGSHSFGSSKVESLDFISFKDPSSTKPNSGITSNNTKNKSSGLFTAQLLKSSSGSNLSALNQSGQGKGKSFGTSNSNSHSGGLLGMATKLNSQSNNSLSSMTSLFNMTSKLNGSAASTTGGGAGSSGLNLLDLERQNKKKKKTKI